MRLEHQVAVVTGASRGIGRTIAQRCAAEGARVALAARNEDALQSVAQTIRDHGGDALVVPTDVTDYESVKRLVSATRERLGRVDLLVNVAGRLAAIGPAWEVDPANWWSDVTVNLLGVFHLCRAVVPGMRERGSGRIVNMVGGGTRKPFRFASGYGCSKAAVMRYTETLAQELTRTESAVKVFALSPGLVRTRMTEQFLKTENGRKWMKKVGERLEAGEDVPPDNAAEVVIVVGTGALDELHGHYLNASDDIERLDSLRQQAPEIVKRDTRTLRMR